MNVQKFKEIIKVKKCKMSAAFKTSTIVLLHHYYTVIVLMVFYKIRNVIFVLFI